MTITDEMCGLVVRTRIDGTGASDVATWPIRSRAQPGQRAAQTAVWWGRDTVRKALH